MSKGSKRRKPLVDEQTISDNWDRIFNTEKEKNEKNSETNNLQSNRNSSGESSESDQLGKCSD